MVWQRDVLYDQLISELIINSNLVFKYRYVATNECCSLSSQRAWPYFCGTRAGARPSSTEIRSRSLATYWVKKCFVYWSRNNARHTFISDIPRFTLLLAIHVCVWTSKGIHELMLQCWIVDPSERPIFAQLTMLMINGSDFLKQWKIKSILFISRPVNLGNNAIKMLENDCKLYFSFFLTAIARKTFA